MTMNALATPATTPDLRVLPGGTPRRPATWYERRSMLRSIVGGCPDHWWTPTARATAACTCDRF
jgi:hypothetical protein